MQPHFNLSGSRLQIKVVLLADAINPQLGERTFDIEGDKFWLDLEADEEGRNAFDEDGRVRFQGIKVPDVGDRSVGGNEVEVCGCKESAHIS